jgi:hypothetical protein
MAFSVCVSPETPHVSLDVCTGLCTKYRYSEVRRKWGGACTYIAIQIGVPHLNPSIRSVVNWVLRVLRGSLLALEEDFTLFLHLCVTQTTV